MGHYIVYANSSILLSQHMYTNKYSQDVLKYNLVNLQVHRYRENHKFQAPKKFENNLIYKLETCFDKQPRQLKINNIYKKKKKKASCEVYA